MIIEIELTDFRRLDDCYQEALKIYKEKLLHKSESNFLYINEGVIRLKEIKFVDNYRTLSYKAVFEVSSEVSYDF